MRKSPSQKPKLNNRTVYLLTQSYLVTDGSREQYSGLQRYVRQLTCLFCDHGFSCIVMQKADRDFDIQFRPGVRVIGIEAKPQAWADPFFNYRAHAVIPVGAPVVYCLVELTYPCARPKSIAVQHGIWWDGEFALWKRRWIEWLNQRAIQKTGGIICVDTNYINWALQNLRNYPLTLHKCHYVPNFVDPQVFCRTPDTQYRNGGMTVLFPRRCEEKRGASIFLDACLKLWDKGKMFRAVFCGWGSMQHAIQARINETPYADRIRVIDVPFDGMAAVYRQSDLVVIPTVRHEGTSLSCIEAMYMGKPVIVTYVGGLPNLVIPGCNGEVVPPLVDELADAIARLHDNEDLRRCYASNARRMAEPFVIERWRASLWGVISLFLLEPQPEGN